MKYSLFVLQGFKTPRSVVGLRSVSLCCRKVKQQEVLWNYSLFILLQEGEASGGTVKLSFL